MADKNENTLFPKDINNRILYTKDIGEQFPFEFSKLLLSDGTFIELNHTVELQGTFDQGNFIIEFPILGIIVTATSKSKLEERFNDAFLKAYSDYRQGDTSFKKFFEELFSK